MRSNYDLCVHQLIEDDAVGEHIELGSKTGVPRTHARDPLHGESQGQCSTAGEKLDYKTAANSVRSFHDFMCMQKSTKNFGQLDCHAFVGQRSSPTFA